MKKSTIFFMLTLIFFITSCNDNTAKESIEDIKNKNEDILASGQEKIYIQTLKEYQSKDGSQYYLNQLSNLNVADLTLGMSRDEVVKTLKNYKENFKFEFKNTKAKLPNSGEYLEYIVAEAVSREEFLRRYGEFFKIYFYAPPNQSRVSVIERSVFFKKGENPTLSAFLDLIKSRYGSPNFIDSCQQNNKSNKCLLIWKFKYSDPNWNNKIGYDKNFDNPNFDKPDLSGVTCFDLPDKIYQHTRSYVENGKDFGLYQFNSSQLFKCGNWLSITIDFYFDNDSGLNWINSFDVKHYDELSLRLASEFEKTFIGDVKDRNARFEANLLRSKIGTPALK